MNLKRQLLLVSVLTLMLPWAGYEFIRETESALRGTQQQMLAGTARALAGSMTRFQEEFPVRDATFAPGDQLYIHPLGSRPSIDGYFDDWPLERDSLRTMRGADGPVHVALGEFGSGIYLYVEVVDRDVMYADSQSIILDAGSRHADRVNFVSSSPPYLDETIAFAAEAPGRILSYKQTAYGFAPEPAITAFWQDVPDGYQLEARIPSALLGTHLGVVVSNTDDTAKPGVRSSSFEGSTPGQAARRLPDLDAVVVSLVQPGMRLLLTDTAGWRIAAAGEIDNESMRASGSGFARRIYDLLVESGKEAAFAQPDPQGREQQTYVSSALSGRETAAWFRSDESGRAVVAVAAPVQANGATLGAVVLQQGTDAVLSLTNEGLARLINVTLITALVVAGVLLGYATWLSRRIRRLSIAAEAALDNEALQSALPSALAEDEIGDLSRSFSSVLKQLGDYNDYLRSLASKLSHELRTPLAIVTSSLENLEHEPLNEASMGYTSRAREGADRLRRILAAMSEASRVEELMANAEPEAFDLKSVLDSTITAYRDVYKDRSFSFDCGIDKAETLGSPELLIQMLDKLVDNAVDFSVDGDMIKLGLTPADESFVLTVENPGPPLPEKMRTQMFDSMVSMRSGKNTKHLGLGLYVARLIAAGHGGSIEAHNTDGGVVFEVTLPHA